MEKPPSPNGRNGRDSAGRFVKGNPGGPGNPHGRRTAELRRAMLDAVTAEDIRAIVAMLVKLARSGDLAAAREILDRCVGKPVSQPDPAAETGHPPITMVFEVGEPPDNWAPASSGNESTR